MKYRMLFCLIPLFLTGCKNETKDQSKSPSLSDLSKRVYTVTDRFYEYEGDQGHLKLMLHKSAVPHEPDFMELDFLDDTAWPDSAEVIQKNHFFHIERDTATSRKEYFYYNLDNVNHFFDKNPAIDVKFYLKGKEVKVLLKRKSRTRKRAFMLH